MALRQLQPSALEDNRKTIEQTYKKLSQLEHILLRPDTYIGSAEPVAACLPVWDDLCGRIMLKSVTYPPGLYKIFDEILVNAADHKQRCDSMTTIRVDIEPENNKISIWNDGTGIPIAMHETEGVYVPELIFGHLLTSSNYDDDEKKVVGGRNGYGAKLANIFSTEFIVETSNEESGRQYKQTFQRNMSSKSKPVITTSKKKVEGWTRITFFPDLSKFGMVSLDSDVVSIMRKRVYDVAGTNPNLRVFLNGDRIPIKSFKDYIALYHNEAPKVPFIHEKHNERWEVALGSSEGQMEQVSFVNSIWTMKGGSHVAHIVDQVVAKIMEQVAKKKKGMKLKPHQIKSHLYVFVNCQIENPAFDSQTKETLTSKPSQFGSKFTLSDEMTKKIIKSGIVENIMAYATFQQNKELTKTDGGKMVRVMGIPKLDDANKAGGREAPKCTLILTEGDSAKALAISGLSVIGRDYYGVFPLRGKLLNVREASHKQILENAEICNLKKILGLHQGKTYTKENLNTLRYGHVLIMTDQDHDGSHIKGLLINFFGHFWPSLLMVDGFLQEFITPIVKCMKGKSEKVFFTMPEYRKWMEGGDDAENAAGSGERRVGWKSKYYKGLGTSTAAEAKSYFSNLCQHLLSFCWRGEDDANMIELAFAKAKVNDRKEWLTNFVPGTFFDHAVDELNYSNFVNKELILFSVADNARSIPNVIDGLKPSQRKVLFACFKRRLLKNEIKVVQLAGYVSEHAAYHHGEASLQATIVGLAQNFVGSNNVNFLVPAGQFGTRLQGGKDAASSRYIFTKLAPVTRALFPEEDDALLNYLQDDGLSIEPEWYCPIIPTVLLNGAEGIGTGWSSQVPCYNPKDLIANVRRMLNAESPQELIPWYRGFEGSIVPAVTSFAGAQDTSDGGDETSLTEHIRTASCKSFDIHGIAIHGDTEAEVKIRELPVRSWTTPYKEFIETSVSGNSTGASAVGNTKKDVVKLPFVRQYSDQSTENKVSFVLSLTDTGVEAMRSTGAHKLLKLSGSVTTSNMMLFDAAGRIAKYNDTTAIFQEFFAVRHNLYDRRRAYILSTLQAELDGLENKQRFVLLVINGKFVVAKRKKAEIVADLQKHGFKPMPKSAKRATGPIAGEGTHSDMDEENFNIVQSSVPTSTSDHDYDYLLSMPLWSLTMERVDMLCTERSRKEEEMRVMEKTTVADLWLHDLTRLEAVLAEDDARALTEAAELKEAAHIAKNGQSRSQGAGRGKKKTAASKQSQVHQPQFDDLHDTPNIIPPPTGRVVRLKQPSKGSTRQTQRQRAGHAVSRRTDTRESESESHTGGGEEGAVRDVGVREQNPDSSIVVVESTEKRSDDDVEFVAQSSKPVPRKRVKGNVAPEPRSDVVPPSTPKPAAKRPRRARAAKVIVESSSDEDGVMDLEEQESSDFVEADDDDDSDFE
jgi:DNA topoisomerase II